MKRALALVEGQTEEIVVRDLIGPRLLDLGLALSTTILTTKRTKAGPNFRGGVVSGEKFRNDLRRLLGDSDATCITTVVDFYGLPSDFPGLDSLPPGATPEQKVEHLEDALRDEFPDRRFQPHVSLHEIEALLFSDLAAVAAAFPGHPGLKTRLRRELGSQPPEEIDDGPETHPSARLKSLIPTYRKTLHGPLILKRIGLPRIRERCPHFDAWVGRLEAVAADE